MKIEVLYFEGCPNQGAAVGSVREVLRQEGLESAVVEQIEVPDAERARQWKFLGSPSIRVNGRDIEPGAREDQGFGYMCRTYQGGLPSEELIRRAIREARAEES